MPDAPRSPQLSQFMPRIALVDSDRSNRTVCAAVLAHFGHDVTGFERLAEAAVQADDRFDVLVVDPGWNYRGQDDFIAFLRQLFPRLPIIIASGGVTCAAPVALRAGVRLIAKPFRVETLRAAIDEVLAADRPVPPER